ncbi:MAG: hypothetical protein IIV90_01830, partial [Oscillospiraceae bacterium]|nr:hypothetical protein [Oscillospiraceae bacterium]
QSQPARPSGEAAKRKTVRGSFLSPFFFLPPRLTDGLAAIACAGCRLLGVFFRGFFKIEKDLLRLLLPLPQELSGLPEVLFCQCRKGVGGGVEHRVVHGLEKIFFHRSVPPSFSINDTQYMSCVFE